MTYETSCCEPWTGRSFSLPNVSICAVVLDWFRRGISEKSILSSIETGEAFLRLFIRILFGCTDGTATKKLGGIPKSVLELHCSLWDPHP